jgi:hypothetical protein
MNQELRVLFASNGACWGAAGLVRNGKDFTDREVEYFTAVAPTIAGATRLVVLGPRGELRSATPEARQWRERLDEIAPGRFEVIMRIMARGVQSTASGGFRARISDGRGQWAFMQASPLIGGEDGDQIGVSIDPAAGGQLISMLLMAYGLSPRGARGLPGSDRRTSDSAYCRAPFRHTEYRAGPPEIGVCQDGRTKPGRTGRPAATPLHRTG